MHSFALLSKGAAFICSSSRTWQPIGQLHGAIDVAGAELLDARHGPLRTAPPLQPRPRRPAFGAAGPAARRAAARRLGSRRAGRVSPCAWRQCGAPHASRPAMPANPMLADEAADVGKKVGKAVGKGAGAAGRAGAKAGRKAATEGKAAYNKRNTVRVQPSALPAVVQSLWCRAHTGWRRSQTQITNPMFNQELSVADDSDEEYDDGPIAVRSAAPEKVSAAVSGVPVCCSGPAVPPA